MPKIEVHEELILQSLDELSPLARKEALRRLLSKSVYLEKAVDRNASKIESVAKQRGLDWTMMSEGQREAFIDELLHE